MGDDGNVTCAGLCKPPYEAEAIEIMQLMQVDDSNDDGCNYFCIFTWVITTLIHCTFCFAILRTRTTGLFAWHIATLVKRQLNPSQREVHPFHHDVSC